jgi:6-phosphogluconolactonase
VNQEELSMRFRSFGAAVAALILALAVAPVATANAGGRSFVYTETNAASGNAILAFAAGFDGSLHALGSYATGGLGTGGGLGTQGEVVLADNDRWLLAVNAGSDDVSVFAVRPDGRLVLTDREPAGGVDPVSVTSHGRLVYVLDAGGAGNVAGFVLDPFGRLHPIPGSVRPLSGSATNPAEVAFSTNGRFLVVTERDTNALDAYQVDFFGRASAPVTTASSGPVPYGFAFDLRNHPIVSEAADSTLSSYRLSAAGAAVISASVPTGGLAACWVAVTPNGRYAYDTNAHGGTISSFAIARSGAIHLIASVAADTGAGSTPLDLATTGNGRFLYVIEAGSHRVMGYRIGAGGSLTAIPSSPSIPAGASGLAAS